MATIVGFSPIRTKDGFQLCVAVDDGQTYLCPETFATDAEMQIRWGELFANPTIDTETWIKVWRSTMTIFHPDGNAYSLVTTSEWAYTWEAFRYRVIADVSHGLVGIPQGNRGFPGDVIHMELFKPRYGEGMGEYAAYRIVTTNKHGKRRALPLYKDPVKVPV